MNFENDEGFGHGSRDSALSQPLRSETIKVWYGKMRGVKSFVTIKTHTVQVVKTTFKKFHSCELRCNMRSSYLSEISLH